jgi:hemerythrin-like metal-binding protein
MAAATQQLFRWGTHYVLGVEEIDRQHRQLGVLLNQLNDAYRAQAPRDALVDRLNALIVAVGEHFATEESLMARREYPETESHKAQHEFLVRQVLEFRRGFQEGEAELTDSMMSYLKDWLRDHILGADKRLGEYLAKRAAGLQQS